MNDTNFEEKKAIVKYAVKAAVLTGAAFVSIGLAISNAFNCGVTCCAKVCLDELEEEFSDQEDDPSEEETE